MSAAPVISALRPVHIEVTAGPLRGQHALANKPVFKIGRSDDNDLVLSSDSKVSRNHIEIRQQNGQVVIVNISQKNIMYVNGQKVEQTALNSVATVMIGDTELTLDFNLASEEKTARVQLASLASPAPQMQMPQPSAAIVKPNPFAGYTPPTPASFPRSGGGNKMPIYIAILVVVFGGLWWAGSGSSKKSDVGIRGSEDIVKDIAASEQVIRNLQQTAEQSGTESAQYKLAQEQYVKGFRDYRQGQYARASQAFMAALSFYPQHELARKYLALSRKKFDELVKFNMNQGRKYLAKTNYRLCAASFSKVLFMLKDPNDATYKEAKQYFDQCTLLRQGRF